MEDPKLIDLISRLSALVPAAGRLNPLDLERLIRAVEALAAIRPNPDQLWTLPRVAGYLGLDLVKAERLLKAPGAPAPFEGERGTRAWRAGDLYVWLDRQGAQSPGHLRLVK